ncbi:hypothetical protein SH1V18_10190 [Vallitalea longa]|uniref:DUF1934 domain-containing protein n=1 Tax=Vallitalea longa TaxID=2936439 RepID=A0A9W5YAS9_9FIRM|nr:DUF1934 domain-containing protein [Vallitalea longa]GKX28539.1 hypothetical protein SH1V18_10190 [Vallitalea longa]
MTKDVIVKVKGVQTDMFETDEIELVTTGKYVDKNNKVYITYVDSTIDGDKETKTTVKLEENQISILRFGAVNSHMVFEKDKTHITHYETPYGVFEINTYTKKINVETGNDYMEINVAYDLSINHMSMGVNTFTISINSAKSDRVILMDDKSVEVQNEELS